MGQPAEGVVQSRGGQGRVEPSQGTPQPPFKDHLPVVVAFRGGRAGSDVRPVEYLAAEAFHPVQGGGFNGGFAEGGMVLVLSCYNICPTPL